MAILLAEGACIIYEVPRTGTTWMRHALTTLGIPWERALAVPGVCGRHSLPEHYPGTYAIRAFVERDPLDWARSYWSYHHDMDPDTWDQNTHYPHRIFGPPVEERFEDFLDRIISTNPRSIYQFFEAFRRHSNLTLKHENLAVEFHDLLDRCGYTVDVERVKDVNRRNESEPRKQLAGVSAKTEQLFRHAARNRLTALVPRECDE